MCDCKFVHQMKMYFRKDLKMQKGDFWTACRALGSVAFVATAANAHGDNKSSYWGLVANTKGRTLLEFIWRQTLRKPFFKNSFPNRNIIKWTKGTQFKLFKYWDGDAVAYFLNLWSNRRELQFEIGVIFSEWFSPAIQKTCFILLEMYKNCFSSIFVLSLLMLLKHICCPKNLRDHLGFLSVALYCLPRVRGNS